MEIPESAARNLKEENDNIKIGINNLPYIINPVSGKDMLTKDEALMAISALCNMVLLDGCRGSKEKYT